MKKLAFLIILGYLLTGCALLHLGAQPEAKPLSDLAASAVISGTDAVKAATLELLVSAEHAVFVEQFSLTDPEILDILIAKGNAGVEIHILLDRWQGENQAAMATLKNNNISVQYYPASKGQYQRSRYLTVDYTEALFYSTDWVPDTSLHSLALRLSGETAWLLTKSFASDWLLTTTLSLELPANPNLTAEHITFTSGVNLKTNILAQLQSAQEEILIESIQISQEDTLLALIAAAERGVQVQIILNLNAEETMPESLRRLLDAGVAVRLLNGSDAMPLSYTFATIDGLTTLFSASAWSHATFVINHESALVIPSPAVTVHLAAQFHTDWQNSRPAGTAVDDPPTAAIDEG